MKKVIIYSLYILNLILYELVLIFGTDMAVMFYFYEDHTDPDFLGAALVIIVLIVLLMFINFLNRLYDHAAGFEGKRRLVGRWARTLMFAGLVTAFIVLMIEMASLPSAQQNAETFMSSELICFAAVMAAIWLYAKTYKKTKDVGARINDLIKENVLQPERRYTLMIEHMEDAAEESMAIEGFVHGEMRVGDQVYTVYPNIPEHLCRVKSLDVGGKRVHTAKNTLVKINVKGLPPKQMWPAYTVLTDIRPYQSKLQSGVNNVENPFLLGLLMEYSRYYRDQKYFNLLLYAVCHAKYLIAGTVQDGKVSVDLMDVLPAKTDVGFPSVSQTGSKDQMMPIFTDWNALKNWKDIVNGEKSVTLMLGFDQLIAVIRNGFTAMVIDPFGPRPYALSQELIESIIHSEGYRKDFIERQNEREKE